VATPPPPDHGPAALLFPGQYALAIVTAIVLIGSIAFLAWVVFG
jgi:hypothetical protein